MIHLTHSLEVCGKYNGYWSEFVNYSQIVMYTIIKNRNGSTLV